ncbi:MAG TPA: hypothetical protein VLS27_19110, partial [Gammaproteobacteria bacterium]|nr:hypothetical protein [Gammaproteobacteria bacterium]
TPALSNLFPALRLSSADGPSAELEPDLRVSVSGAGGETLGSCALWWRDTPRFQGRTVGYIGKYSARDPESAGRLLHVACRRLAGQGRMLAIGPVDGSTWMDYRCIVDAGSEPPFFLEPRNPPECPDHFRAAGFEPLAYYRSSVQEDLSTHDARLVTADARMKDIGIRIRAFDTQRVEEELRRIHALTLESFTQSLLFKPIPVDTFIARYRVLMQTIDPELVLLAEHRGRLVGYLFALSNALELTRGQRIETVILKTIAVLPARQYAGLGHVLAMHGAGQARALGYTRAIHALMREGNGSANWSARLGRPIRRYALFAKALDGLR